LQAPIDLRTERCSLSTKQAPRGQQEPGVRPSTEPKPQLPEQNRWWRRRRLGSKPKLSEQRGGSLFGGGGFEPAHGPTVGLGEQKLVARSRRRLESGRILWRLRDDL